MWEDYAYRDHTKYTGSFVAMLPVPNDLSISINLLALKLYQ